MSDGATIVNGGGTQGTGVFTVLSSGVIDNPGIQNQPTPKLVVADNGLLQKFFSNTNEVNVPVEQQGGDIQLNGLGMKFNKGFTKTGGSTSLGGGTLQVVGTFDQSEGTTDLGGGSLTAGTMQESGGIIQLGGGTLTVSDTVFILAGATLSGPGTVSGDVSSDGLVNVSAGNGTGTLNITGNYAQSDTGVLHLNLGGLVAGNSYDQLNISGTAYSSGTLSATLVGGFTPAAGNSFTFLLCRNSPFGGAFGTDLPPLGGGLTWVLNYDPNDVVLKVQ